MYEDTIESLGAEVEMLRERNEYLAKALEDVVAAKAELQKVFQATQRGEITWLPRA